MPITSSSAPLRDLVNQYGANSPQVTRIVNAVNSSAYLENQWNAFAARTAPGGGSPVIRVDPMDDSGRGNATGGDPVPADTNANTRRVLLSLDYFRSGPAASSGRTPNPTDEYGQYDLTTVLAHELQHINTFDARRATEQMSLTGGGAATRLATGYANLRTDDELASKVAEYNALKAAGANDVDIASRINRVQPDGSVSDFFRHIKLAESGVAPVSVDAAISREFRDEFNRQVPSNNSGVTYGALYMADGITQMVYRNPALSNVNVSTDISPQALIDAGLRLLPGQSLTLNDPTSGVSTRVLSSTAGSGGTEFVYTTSADGGAVVVRGSYSPGGGVKLESATAFQDADNLSNGRDVTSQVRGVLSADTVAAGGADGLSLINAGRAALGSTPLNPTPSTPSETAVPPVRNTHAASGADEFSVDQIAAVPGAPTPVQPAAPVVASPLANNPAPLPVPSLDGSDNHLAHYPAPEANIPVGPATAVLPTVYVVGAQSGQDLGVDGSDSHFSHLPVATSTGTQAAPYLAPSLKDLGYTGVTGTTPYKPATPEQLSTLQDTYNNSPVVNAPPVISSNAIVINVNFDGTQNNGLYPKPGETPTVIYRLSELQAKANGAENTLYFPGVGAQTVPSGTTLESGAADPHSSPSNWESTPVKSGAIANGIVDSAYDQLARRVTAILLENPNAEISINISGFSRGAAQDIAFANLVDKRGIPGLYEPGHTVIDTMVVLDAVKMAGSIDGSWPTNVKNNVAFVATGETRTFFPSEHLGPDANVIGLPVNHAGLGGSFNEQGTSAVTLGLVHQFLVDSGMKIADIPESLQPDWGQMHIYNSGLDNYGRTIFDFDESGKRYYEGGGLGSPSVQDVLLHGAPHVATPPNPAAGDAADYTIPANPALPNGPKLTVIEVTDRAGHDVVTVRDESGEVVLTTKPGETLLRDPDTGKLTVTKDGHEVRSYIPVAAPNPDASFEGSDAHLLNHPPTNTTTQPEATSSSDDAATQQIITAFQNAATTPATGPGVQLADAGPGTTVSDAGPGITIPSATIPAGDGTTVNQPPALTESSIPATETVAIPNTAPADPSKPFVQYGTEYTATLQPYASALGLLQTLGTLQNWSHMGDVAHLNTVVSLASNFNTLTDGSLGNLSGLSEFAGYVNLAQNIQSGNTLGTLSSINTISSGAVDGAINAALGSSGVPYIGVVMALNDFGHHPLQSIGSLAGMYFGPVGSMIGSMIGGLLDGLLGGHSIPEPPQGAVHFEWDANGTIQIQTDHDITNGAASANSTANSVLGILQSVVTANNDNNNAQGQSANNLAIDPSRLPRVGFTAGQSWIEITHPDGSITKEGIDPATIGQRMVQIALENDALVPVWQIQTAQAHAHTAVQAQADANANNPDLDPNINVNANTAADIDGRAPVAPTAPKVDLHHNPAVFGTQGTTVLAADHQTQTFAALVVHLNSPGAQHAVDAIKTSSVLHDMGHDGFWEQTQWVAGKDDAGNAQGMLVLDRNNNGIIETTDILHLGGDSTQTNSLAWLDSNGDGKLDASDPAFAAVKVWVDINNDGRVEDGEMQTPPLTSINFTTGQITYADGQSHTLTATTLTAETAGSKLGAIEVVGEDGKLRTFTTQAMGEDGKLHTVNAGAVIVHRSSPEDVYVNEQGQQVEASDPHAHVVTKHSYSYDFQAAALSDWEGTADQDQHRHGEGNVAGTPHAAGRTCLPLRRRDGDAQHGTASYLIARYAMDTRATGQFTSKLPANASGGRQCELLSRHRCMRSMHTVHGIRSKKYRLQKNTNERFIQASIVSIADRRP